MIFSKVAKDEILSVERSMDALFALLSGEILSAGSLVINKKQITFEMNSENQNFLSSVKAQICRCFRANEYDVDVSLISKNKYSLKLSQELGPKILDELNIVRIDPKGNFLINRIPTSEILQDEECLKSYLAGAFVGSGSVSTPKNDGGGYHMEWVCQTEEKADFICNSLAEFNIISKKVERNGTSIAYIKGSDDICQALALMGATKAMLKIESNLVERAVRNNINRQSNCQSANLDKTLVASAKEVRAIKIIEETIGLNSLRDSLKEVAIIRKENPQASLAEISNMLGSKITRAAISLKLKQIIKIAETLGGDNGE